MESKIKMLIIEDNEDERLFMKEGFIQSGLYEIVGEAENGNELQQLLDQPFFSLPDVIFSDLNMPGKNGFEVITDVQANKALSHIPVIILTTAPLVPYADRCIKLGACAYYTKPDTFLEYKEFAEKIHNSVSKCINNSKLQYNSVENKLNPSFLQKIQLSNSLFSFESLKKRFGFA